MQLWCLDENNAPVSAAVEFIFSVGAGTHALWGMTDVEGSVNIPLHQGRRPDLALVKPVDGHWNSLLEDPARGSICRCIEIDLDRTLGWWKSLIVGGRSNHQRGQGVRIGVIDIGFRPSDILSHVEFFDIEGEPLVTDREATHGMRVCKILGSRDDSIDASGIADSASIYFVDVSEDDCPETWSFNKLFAGIRILTDVFEVDLINISGGFSLPPPSVGQQRAWALEFAEFEVARAIDKGVLLIAAVGNASAEPVAAPACLDGVIGVGAIGKAGLAPKYTNLFGYEQLSAGRLGCFGKAINGNGFFHHLDTSYGDGVDVVGPGLGMVLRFNDGVVAEYDGTSYAAPVVTATAACLMARGAGMGQLKGSDRVIHGQRLVKDACIDLGLDKARQGWGLPVLDEGVT